MLAFVAASPAVPAPQFPNLFGAITAGATQKLDQQSEWAEVDQQPGNEVERAAALLSAGGVLCGRETCTEAVWSTQATNGYGTCGSQIVWAQGNMDGLTKLEDACNYVASANGTPECSPCGRVVDGFAMSAAVAAAVAPTLAAPQSIVAVAPAAQAAPAVDVDSFDTLLKMAQGGASSDQLAAALAAAKGLAAPAPAATAAAAAAAGVQAVNTCGWPYVTRSDSYQDSMTAMTHVTLDDKAVSDGQLAALIDDEVHGIAAAPIVIPDAPVFGNMRNKRQFAVRVRGEQLVHKEKPLAWRLCHAGVTYESATVSFAKGKEWEAAHNRQINFWRGHNLGNVYNPIKIAFTSAGATAAPAGSVAGAASAAAVASVGAATAERAAAHTADVASAAADARATSAAASAAATSLPSATVPVAPLGCKPCTDKPMGWMMAKGKTPFKEACPSFGKMLGTGDKCKSSGLWRLHHYCRKSCYHNGAGYWGDTCCP